MTSVADLGVARQVAGTDPVAEHRGGLALGGVEVGLGQGVEPGEIGRLALGDDPPRRLAGDLEAKPVVDPARSVVLLVFVVHGSIVSPGIVPPPPDPRAIAFGPAGPDNTRLDHPTRSRAMHEPPTLFFDVGGVLLTNGWDTPAAQAGRRDLRAGIPGVPDPPRDAQDRLRDRPDRPRYLRPQGGLPPPASFTPDDFKTFMFSSRSRWATRSTSSARLAATGKYRLYTLNNESRELHDYRVEDLRPRPDLPRHPGLVLPRPGEARRGHLPERHGDRVVLRRAGAVHR